jgi:hypothetical protein
MIMPDCVERRDKDERVDAKHCKRGNNVSINAVTRHNAHCYVSPHCILMLGV